MSIRECVEHVHVRGTCISTSMIAPSKLHVTVVHQFGLPNQHGIIACDNFLLHLRFDNKDDHVVHVWAQAVQSEEAQYCTVA